MTHELAKLLEQVPSKELRNQLVAKIEAELQDAYDEGVADELSNPWLETENEHGYLSDNNPLNFDEDEE